MSAGLTAIQVLDRTYLEVRCKLLDIAACLDRIERAADIDEVSGDLRLVQIREGIALLQAAQADRAERIQMLFSDPYVPGWNRRGNGRQIGDRG